MSNQILLVNEIGCSSFELRKMSKGYSWTIKIYHNDIEKAYQLSKEIDFKAQTDFGTSGDTPEAI